MPNLSISLQFKQILKSKQKHKLKHTTHTVHKNARTNDIRKHYTNVIRNTSPSNFINHIHLYPVILVTIFPFFLNEVSESFMSNESFQKQSFTVVLQNRSS